MECTILVSFFSKMSNEVNDLELFSTGIQKLKAELDNQNSKNLIDSLNHLISKIMFFDV